MSGTVVILAHAYDVGAALVAQAIAAQAPAGAVEVVRPEGLALARWSHRIDERGGSSTRLVLADGRRLETARIGCVLDRMAHVAHPHFLRASAKDRDYAAAELQALIGSWLLELGARVVNPPLGCGRLNRVIPDRAWLAAAAAVGLPVARNMTATAGRLLAAPSAHEICRPRAEWPWGGRGPVPADLELDQTRASHLSGVLVAGEETVGPLAGTYGAACRALARARGHLLLECCFALLADGPCLVAVEPQPELTSDLTVGAVARLLQRVVQGEAMQP